jgi:hypothetical protein
MVKPKIFLLTFCHLTPSLSPIGESRKDPTTGGRSLRLAAEVRGNFNYFWLDFYSKEEFLWLQREWMRK